MANKEVYKLSINIGVNGDSEAKKKITSLESITEKVEKKFKNLSNITASPTAKLKDLTTPAIEKIESKAKKIGSMYISPTAKIVDNASSNLDKIESKVEKLDKKESKSKISIQDEATKALSNVDSKISSWTKTIAKKTIAIGLAGTMLVGGLGIKDTMKTYTDFEQGLSNVKAITDATDTDMLKLKETALDLGASTAWSASNVTQAEELLGQAGYTTQENIAALPGLLSLASAGDLDLAAATDIAVSSMKSFNLDASKASHVADVLSLSANATNSDVTDLGEAMKYIAPVAQSLGISLEDTASAVGVLSNAGIKGSQAGTVLRQTLNRLASPTKEAGELISQYGINAFDSQGNMKSLGEVIDNLNSSLTSLNSQQKADVISTIFGTESMSGVLALMNQGGSAVSTLTKQLEEADGAAQKVADTKLDNLAGQMENLGGAVETMKINLGDRLAPYAKEFVSWLTDKMPSIENGIMNTVDYVSTHIDEIKTGVEGIVATIAVVSGINFLGSLGNSLSGINKFISLMKGAKIAEEAAGAASGLSKIGEAGSLLPAIFSPAGVAVAASVALIGTTVATQNDLMNKSITTTTEELGPLERVMNELNGHLNKSKKEMVEAGLIYDDFGESISDSFKKGAQDASKSLLKIEMDLKKLNGNGIADESGLNNLKNYVNDVAYESINAMKEQRSKIQSEFQKTFSLDGVTSDVEQKVLDSLGDFFEAGTNKQLEIRDDIYQFASDKIKEHGKLLDGDLKEIKDKISKAKALELEYTNAQNAYDQAFAKSQFNNDASKITGIDGASELLQERAKNHQSAIDKIENNYKGTLAYYESLLSNPNLSDEERNNFQNGYDSAKTTRDQAVKQEKEGYASDREVIYSHYDDSRGMLNEKTGEKFSDADITAHKGTDYLKNHFQNLNQITQEGWYRIKNTTSGEMEDIYATVDKDTGEISGAWSKTAGWSGGYTDELKQKVKELGETHEAEKMRIQNSLSALTGSTLDSNNQVISSTGAVIGQLEGVQDATDGAITGIINISGTPMEITSNASGQTTEMHEFKGSMDDISPSKDVHINSDASEATGEINGTTSALNEMPSSKTIIITTIFKKIYDGVKSLFGFGAEATSDVEEQTERTQQAFQNNASGTDYATAGLSTVNERGWELSDRTLPIIGQYNDDPVVNLQRGTRIKNHMDSVSEMKADVKREVTTQMPQQKVQVYQPQLAVAGGGNSFSFNMGGININNMADKAAIIKQATQEFAKQFMEVLNNQA